MPAESIEKVTVFATHGPDDPERATLPFVMANAALAMDCEAVVILQGTGVLLSTTKCAEHIFAAGLPPLQEQLRIFMDNGGKLLVCTPCIKERRLESDMLIPGAEPIAAARVIKEVTESKAVLNY